MTLEYLSERKAYYEDKHNYFKNLGFDTLATEFQNIIDLINKMENYIKEKENEKNTNCN